MAGNEVHDRAIGVIIRANRLGELRTALVGLVGKAHLKRIFGDAGAFIAELVVNADGSGATVALGCHSYLTEAEFQHAKDIKADLNAQFGSDIEGFVTTSPRNPGAADFWSQAAALPTPLYPKGTV